MSEPLGRSRLSNSGDGPGDIRLWPLVFVVLTLFTLFIGRLFQLQILEGEYLASRSQANYVRTVAARRSARHDRRSQWPRDRREPTGLSRRRDAERDPAAVADVFGPRRNPGTSGLRHLGEGGPTEGASAFPGGLAFRGPDLRAARDGGRASLCAPRGRVLRKAAARVRVRRAGGPAARYDRRDRSGRARPRGSRRLPIGETIGKTGIEASYEVHLRGRSGV